jgi:hypothetical protein
MKRTIVLALCAFVASVRPAASQGVGAIGGYGQASSIQRGTLIKVGVDVWF